MPDGYRLPIRRWHGATDPDVVALGLHGFNDYSRAFAPLGEDLAAAGITTYAVDQRGFGDTRQAGRWHGSARLQADLRTLIRLLRARYPQARLAVIGESMGAAVALAASAQSPLDIDALVLIAPAVWSRATMPWYQRLALDVTARTLPALKLTGNGIPIAPSDNKSMLRMMSRDPLVIKATRVDALWGVTNLMDQAATWPDIRHNPEQPPLLILYGERDSIIPPRAFCRFIARVPLDGRTRLGLYADGWHMLPRDLQGAAVRQDILSWLQDPNAPLPSGEEIGPDRARLQRFCQAASPSLAAPRCPIEGEPDHVPDDIPAASRPCSRVASRYDRWPGRGRQGLANGRAGA
ncbi:alpha/beta fold hydrolase [Halochromatium glycolicum]|uniref:Alpha/beta hydrolase n=1 Tax=Halochromatium glycolicum TaxID=85075 RepID=A0AAJ0U4D0_9GAMM|nr:alpha/beta fold hydrolase [Halochromatium glycolicum]MBK1705056.1 alpha/beta hydrolase [Halochromatium glycolicum]